MALPRDGTRLRLFPMSRILIVEDDGILRHDFELLLAEDGHESVAAHSTRLALEILEAMPVDVVLTDHRLGATDGLGLANVVTERWPWVPVVLMARDLDNDLQRRADEAGVAACLRKPFTGPLLSRAVDAAFRVAR